MKDEMSGPKNGVGLAYRNGRVKVLEMRRLNVDNCMCNSSC